MLKSTQPPAEKSFMDTTMTTPAMTQPLPGDLVIEAIGSSVRFWMVAEGRKVRLLARCDSDKRFGRNLVSSTGTPVGPAKDLTPGAVYNRTTGEALVRKYFIDYGTLHFYYSGRGPSGQRWGFFSAGEQTHYSITRKL